VCDEAFLLCIPVETRDRAQSTGDLRASTPAGFELAAEAFLAWLGVDEARTAELKDEGVVNWPDESYAAAW
jgi:hypothetical protein